MKKTVLFIVFLFIISSPAHSVAINDPWNSGSSEMNLRDIWNRVLGDTYTGSSQSLYNTYGVGRTDSTAEYLWNSASGTVNAEIRYAGYEQSFGYVTESGQYTTLASNIPWGISSISIDFQTPQNSSFSWFECWKSGSTQGKWYSNDLLNSDRKDHFVAFEVPDFLNAYANAGLRQYMLAFEDLSLGDQDYQDLVVFLKMQNSAPVPEPATMFLVGVGLIALGCIRKKIKAESKAE